MLTPPDWQGGFGCALMLKDLGLATQAASNAKAPVPLGSLAEQLYTVMCQHGYSTKDFGAIFDYLHKKPQ
jgi:3-hydroxyisobutyrate dehydrogenase